VAALVIRGAALVRRRHHQLALGAEHDLLERVGEVGSLDCFVTAACGEQGRLVDEVRKVGTDHPRCAGRERTQIDVRPEWHAARVHFEDLLAPVLVGRLDGNAAVEPSRTQ
jgi:hypothetical protein